MIYDRSAMSTLNSFSRLADVMATRKATFIRRWDTQQTANSLKGGLVITERTRLRSHCGVGFTIGGNVLISLFRNQVVIGLVKKVCPSTVG